MTGADKECLELVRAGDKDRFLSSLFAPDDARPHLLALYAFNLEITRIEDAVSEPMLGEIRRQWWRDTLTAIYAGEKSPHPVGEALAAAINFAKLPHNPLEALIDAHEADLFDDKFPDVASLEVYLGETSSALIQMAAVILAGEKARDASDAAGLAGVSYGLSKMLVTKRRRLLPKSLDTSAAIAHARRRLAEARGELSKIPQAARPAFLPVSLTEHYLRAAERNDATYSEGGLSLLKRQFIVWRAARANRF